MKRKPKQFFIKGKDVITDPNAPVVSNEFVDHFEGNEYRGQTIEVQSDTKLEQDTGTGDAVVLRTYEFGTNPEMLAQLRKKLPHPQEMFNAHVNVISGMLWQDGLAPAEEIEPRLIFSKDRRKYMIIVGARPRLGKTMLEKTRTLTEIINEGRPNSNQIQRSVPVSSTKKTKTSRTA